MNMLHATASDLRPVQPPVGVYPRLCATQPITMMLKEKAFSLSGDSFSIVDTTTGQPLLKCSGKALSLHDRKKITDLQGQVLFNLAEKHFSLHKTFVAEDAQGKDVLRVKKKWSIGTKIGAEYEQNGQQTLIELTGDFWGGSANIQLANGTILAHVQRKLLTGGELFADAQSYLVSVAPGVDIALVAALCICFDEVKNED